MCKLLVVSMFFSKITDKLLPFDVISILILDKLAWINWRYFSNVTSTYYMKMK